MCRTHIVACIQTDVRGPRLLSWARDTWLSPVRAGRTSSARMLLDVAHSVVPQVAHTSLSLIPQQYSCIVIARMTGTYTNVADGKLQAATHFTSHATTAEAQIESCLILCTCARWHMDTHGHGIICIWC
mmetsp:Transcript_30812/g.50971  ORF Transcript_30812/g.50971 Transcript_30812/m.50971 type:complete len:129 (-) Transcript_30812:153-539(-)